MKIAICSQGPGMNSPVDQRFGRCPYFVFVDSDTGENMCSLPSENAGAAGGAGIGTAQFLAKNGAQAVLTGAIGPNAMTALKAAGIKVYTGITGTVADAYSQYKEGRLTLSPDATVGAHHGAGFGGRKR